MKRVENWGDESWLDYVVAVVSSKLIFSNAHPSIDAFVSLLFFVSSIACPYPFWILHLLSWFLRTVDYLSDHPTHDQRADEPGFQPKANKVATLTQWNSLFFSLFYTLYLLSVILQCIDSRRSGRLKRARNGAVGGGGFFPSPLLSMYAKGYNRSRPSQLTRTWTYAEFNRKIQTRQRLLYVLF